MFNWRWKLFWLKDKLTGSNIKKKYNDLQNDYNQLDLEFQNHKLKKLLKYAKSNCNYYKKFNLNLESFPVINKQIIKDNFDEIFNKKYNKNKLHKMSTSGSTGTPFTVYQNKEKRDSVLAELIFFGEKADFIFGEKELYSRIWVNSIKKSKLRKFIQNIECFDISKMDEQNLNLLFETIIRKKIQCVLGYASTLYLFNQFLEKKTIYKSNLKSFISGSELLNEETRKGLSKKFNCKVYSRYSNEENGLLAQDNGISKEMWLNETNYYFEFLKLEENTTAVEGELARIVVTDLYNYAMPMIRYDTGDLCIFKIVENRKIITEIYGRRVDILTNTKGIVISPHLITNNMWDIKNIIQWKFSQIGKKEYKVLLNVNQKFSSEVELSKKLKEIIGSDAIINFEYTNEIPVLNSGKRKYIENLWKK